ncbi:MAG: heme ABC transporter permease CcmB [Desulfovibrionales bacterium]|nr:MAG: heme ABC transporter permease CcmB [Desulfovibrionales bacterium]
MPRLPRFLILAHKDLRLMLGLGLGLVQTVLLGLLIIFVFSLSLPVGETMSGQGAAAIFWLASVFGLVLLFNALYHLEEANGVRLGLLLAPISPTTVFVGKALAGGALLVLAQIFFLIGLVVFLGQSLYGQWLWALGLVLAVDLGLVIMGSLLGALSQGQAARESLLSVILFPLLVPLLLGGVKLGGGLLSGVSIQDETQWMTLIMAFDALFAAVALILFPLVFREG